MLTQELPRLQTLPESTEGPDGQCTCRPGTRCREYYEVLVDDICLECATDEHAKVLDWLLDNDLSDDKYALSELAEMWQEGRTT